MGFHYARDHDLAGFWGEVCELAHRVHREAALLTPTSIADLEKTLNIGPTQRLFRQVSACHQDVEIPAQALDEQVYFVLGLLFLFLVGREISHGPDEEVVVSRGEEHFV